MPAARFPDLEGASVLVTGDTREARRGRQCRDPSVPEGPGGGVHEARGQSSGGSVAFSTSARVTSGATSTSFSPSGVTSMTARSVMIRCTTPRPV